MLYANRRQRHPKRKDILFLSIRRQKRKAQKTIVNHGIPEVKKITIY